MIQATERAANGIATLAVASRGGAPSPDATPVHVISLEGDFDLSNVRDLDDVIGRSFDAGARDLVADLSRVDFLDARTVHVLVDGWKRAARRNGRFVIVNPPQRIWRVFVLVGASRTFLSFASRHEALAHLAGERFPLRPPQASRTRSRGV